MCIRDRYYGRGRLYGVDCHDDTAKTDTAPPILAALLEAAAAAGSAYVNHVAEHYTAPAFNVVDNAPVIYSTTRRPPRAPWAPCSTYAGLYGWT